ncbi:MAG: hypothetical protein PUA83_09340 [Clostridiales bacterium]|nr:hypothetical protein [Clostridiales bacterium]
MSDTIQAKYTLIRYAMVWTAGVAFWGILQLHMPFFICRPKVLNRILTPDPASSPSQTSIVFFRGGGAESFVRPHRIFPGKCGRKKKQQIIFSAMQ